MKREQIMGLIRDLAQSTGLYSRLYLDITEMDEEARNDYFEYLEKLNFKNDLDFIVWYEEGRRI